jgi:SWI/SNF-related matrix-associated actin-dependent regulator of chromatin subfamily A-like protein 1
MPAVKPFQLHGARTLAARDRFYLADEMRLGKSVQTAIALSLSGAFDNREMNVIVAPASAVHDWPIAIREWCPEAPKVSYVRLDQIARRPFDFRYDHYDVIVMSYECMVRSIDWLNQFRFNTVVFDEAHYLKTEDSVRTKAAFGNPKATHRPEIPGLAQRAKRAWYLSGTPMPNHPGELHTVLRNNWPQCIINEKTGGPMNLKEFEGRFCKRVRKNYKYSQIVGGRNLKNLKERIEPYFLRRTMKQVMPEMDRLTFQMLPVQIRPMEPEIQLEADALQEALANCKTDEERIAIIQKAAAFDHLRSHLAVFKALEVSRRIGDECYVDKTLKQVVCGWHVDALKLIERHCKETGLYPLYIDGETPPHRRGELAQEFRENPKHQVMCFQIKAGGVGLPLHAADILTFNDMSFVPGDNVQAAFRIMHIESKNPKLIRIAYAQGTADERVAKILKRKIQDTSTVFDAGAESELAEALTR